MMFLFAGHSAGLLNNNHVQLKLPWLLESQLHGSQRKSYLSVPFFFHLRCEWLVGGRLYLPNQHHESHHKICNLRYETHGYLWVLPLVTLIDGFSQSGYCMPHSLGLIKNRTNLFSGFWERPVLRKQTLRFQKTMSIEFWNHDGCFLSTAASDNKRKRSWKQTVLFFIFLYTLLACNTT